MNDKSDILNILRNISFKKGFSQRQMAKELGFSLGKLNYCIKALQKKGLVKLKNFQKKTDKMRYLQYVVRYFSLTMILPGVFGILPTVIKTGLGKNFWLPY